jgi:hypothetical protein
MATRKSRNSTRETTARSSHKVESDAQQQAQRGSQQQLAFAADATSALLRGAELWSQLQLQALQRSGQTWSEAAEQLRTATTPQDLVTVQTQLMTNSVLQFLGIAQDFVQMTNSALQARDAGRPAMSGNGAAESVPAMMNAWQAMVDPMGLAGAAAASVARH